MAKRIRTVGHSTHSIERFIQLLQQNGVTALADVRSAPYSRFNPQFNREPLRAALKCAEIEYVFLGRELGARSDDPLCYENGMVVYDRLAATALFQRGLDRLVEGARRYDIALVCAEKDPLLCHRTILVSRQLILRGVSVEHILGDGSIETHDAALSRLVRLLGLPERDLFRSRASLIAEAYERQGTAIAYQLPEEPPTLASGGRSRA